MTYASLAPRLFFLYDAPRRYEKTLFHVQTGDYFATLATLLGLVVDTNPELNAPARKALESTRDDLIYLQQTHRIVPKYRTYLT